ncbi:MAG: hypothetical protein ACOYX5_19860 [Actinomycetota bacterium]
MNPAQTTPTNPTLGQRLTGLLATLAIVGIIIGLPVSRVRLRGRGVS